MSSLDSHRLAQTPQRLERAAQHRYGVVRAIHLITNSKPRFSLLQREDQTRTPATERKELMLLRRTRSWAPPAPFHLPRLGCDQYPNRYAARLSGDSQNEQIAANSRPGRASSCPAGTARQPLGAGTARSLQAELLSSGLGAGPPVLFTPFQSLEPGYAVVGESKSKQSGKAKSLKTDDSKKKKNSKHYPRLFFFLYFEKFLSLRNLLL